MAVVSVATPLVSGRIWEKWFSLPNLVLLAPIPVVTAGLFAVLFMALRHLPTRADRFCWLPFVGAIGIFLLGFLGLAYSFFPYVVRPADDLAGGGRAGIADDHVRRRDGGAADHRRLLGLRLPGVLGQGDGPQLLLMKTRPSLHKETT